MSIQDTKLGNSVNDYIQVLNFLKFKKVAEFPIERINERQELLNIYAREDGFILSFDTYNSTQVNGARFVCSALGNDNDLIEMGNSSPVYVDDFYTGNIIVTGGDARENLIEKVNCLKKNATLAVPFSKENVLAKFVLSCEQDYTSLQDQGITDFHMRSAKVDEIRKNRLEVMPDWVGNMLKYTR